MDDDAEILRMVKSGEYVLAPSNPPDKFYADISEQLAKDENTISTEFVLNVAGAIWGFLTGISYFYDNDTGKFWSLGEIDRSDIKTKYAVVNPPPFIKAKLATMEDVAARKQRPYGKRRDP